MRKAVLIINLLFLLFVSCKEKPNADKENANMHSKDSVAAIAKSAFVYGMPLILMDMTRKKVTNTIEVSSDLKAPINQLVLATKFPDAKFTDVVKPNADTYYRTGFLDLSNDAIVLSVPNTNGRYYLLPLLDAYTNVFASPGKRTTGTEAGTFLITGPNWKGTVPADMKQIKSPTDMVWLLGRIQVNSEEDGKNIVVPIEKKITVTPLNSWGTTYIAPKGQIDPNLPKEGPNAQLEQMPIEVFFNYMNKLMIDNPPPARDSVALKMFAEIGVGKGLNFDLSKFDKTTQEELKKVPVEVMEQMKEVNAKGNLVKPINGWSLAYKGFGDYKTDYNLRAAVAFVGLGANLPEDAIYPASSKDSEGNIYDGKNKYILHFEKGKTPPVKAFWSLTMYNNNGHFIENPINRYTIGNRNPLKFNPDGSLDIYIQNLSPGKDKENNWLPAPADSFNLMLRMYWPTEEILNGSWTIPAVVKQK